MFDEAVIRVITLCQEEAVRLGQTREIGTAFLLLGLIEEGQGIAAQVLLQMGVDLETARREVEKIVGRRPPKFYTVNVPFSQNAGAVLKQAFQEAKQLGHPTIRTEHLLLVIVTLKQGVAYQVLQNLQVDTEQLQSAILATMGENKLSPEGIAAQESLTELQTVIETDEYFTDEDKAEILDEIQFLVRLWNWRVDERTQKVNRRSLRMLRGFIAELPNDAPQLATYQRLLSTIAEQF